jgi:hypothetical protein
MRGPTPSSARSCHSGIIKIPVLPLNRFGSFFCAATDARKWLPSKTFFFTSSMISRGDRIVPSFFWRPVSVPIAPDFATQLFTPLAPFFERQHQTQAYQKRLGNGSMVEPDAISNAVGYAKFRTRSHNALIRVYDETGNVIATQFSC